MEHLTTDNVLISLPDLGSQNLTSMSLLPETTNPFCGCQSTHLTSQPCPFRQPWPQTPRTPTLTRQHAFLLGFSITPDFDQTVIPARDEFFVVRTPSSAMTCLSMPLKPVDISQMGRKVLDHADPINRQERLTIVRISECPDRIVVHLSDGLVVE